MFSLTEKISERALRVGFYCAALVMVQAAFADPPSQRAVRVYRYEPQIFEAAGRYEFDAERVLRRYQSLMEILSRQPEYAELLAVKPAAIKLSVQGDPVADYQPSYRINPSAIRAWKADLKEVLSDFGYGYSYSSYSFGSASSSGGTPLRTRLIDSINEAASPQARARYGLAEATRRLTLRAQLLALAEELRAKGRPEGELRWDLSDRIYELGEADLDWFMEDVVVRPLLEKQADRLNDGVIDFALEGFKALSLKISADKVEVNDVFKGKLSVVEVPPEIGLFRGTVGNDCATAVSSGYAASPMERVFFIYNEAGKVLGYMNVTHVVFQGAPAIYVNTIDGSKLTTPETDAVLRAVYANRETFGAREMVLPVREKLSGNINFTAVREAFITSIRDGQAGALTYVDAPLRKWIDEAHGSAPYDRADTNRVGIRYEPRPSQTQVKSQLTVRAPREMSLDEAPVDKWDTLRLAMSEARREDPAARRLVESVLRDSGVTVEEVRHFASWAENWSHEDLAHFRATASRELAALGIESTPDFLKDRGGLLMAGLRSCPDFAAAAEQPGSPAMETGICNLILKK